VTGNPYSSTLPRKLADDGISHELIVLATEFVLRVASLQLDAGYTQASRRLLGAASSLAHETGALTLNAWVLARRGEQKIHEKDAGQALAYTRAAAELVRQASPAARAFILAKYALALSLTGEPGGSTPDQPGTLAPPVPGNR
jgi:hypothetical protein